MQSIFSITTDQLIRFQPRDLLDIIVITIIIYAGIQFLRETRSIPVFIGILSLALLYGFALFFDLPLSQLILRSFFGFFIVVIAIIFEKELRRFFFSFGFFGIARQFLPHPSQTVIETISDAVIKLKQNKTGALIVFPGKDPVEHLLVSGFYLKGEVSEPLLLSIFSTASPGHDGAIIIENNLIERFGVHLPLAENFKMLKEYGLRHRAALGLSENSDALIIAISEEKGIVNIFQKGKFYEIRNRDELLEKLIKFYKGKDSVVRHKNLPSWFISNFLLLASSFVIATGIWFATTSGSQFAVVQREFLVTPEFKNIPSNYVVNDIAPEEIDLLFEGRSVDFETIRPENVRVLVDLSSIKGEGQHQIIISKDNIKLPFNINFSVIKIDPNTIKVDIVKNATSSLNKNN